MSFESGTTPRFRKRQRICHVCGDKIIPQAFCPSCGHPLCGECRRLTSTPGHIHSFSSVIHQGPHPIEAGHLPTEPVLAETRAPQPKETAPEEKNDQSPKTVEVARLGKRSSVVSLRLVESIIIGAKILIKSHEEKQSLHYRRSDCQSKGCVATDVHSQHSVRATFEATQV